MAVYFIQHGEGGEIKIGTTCGNPYARMSTLQTGTPLELRLLVSIPGGVAEEVAVHERFAALRVRGEWFRPEPALLEFIASLRGSRCRVAMAPLVAAANDVAPLEPPDRGRDHRVNFTIHYDGGRVIDDDPAAWDARYKMGIGGAPWQWSDTTDLVSIQDRERAEAILVEAGGSV